MVKFKVFVKHGFVRAEGDDAGSIEETTMKLTVPRKWKEGPVGKIKDCFVEFFNKKHAGNPDAAPLVAADVHLVRERDHEPLNDAEIVNDVLKNREELGIGHGAGPAQRRQKKAAAIGANAIVMQGKLRTSKGPDGTRTKIAAFAIRKP